MNIHPKTTATPSATPSAKWPLAAGLALLALAPTHAQQAPAAANTANMTIPGPYHVLKTVKVGGEGGWDYVYADADGGKVYVARSGQTPHIAAYDLTTLAPAGDIPNVSAHGVAADTLSHHAFASSNPVAMFDTKTMALIKTIPVQGRPDGILADAFNHHVYIFSHEAPNVTVLNAADGAVLGTIDLGGAPEQAQSDGKGRLFVDLEDKDAVAVVDAKTMKLTATYSLNGHGGGPGGLGLDIKNHVLFVACHDPQNMVMLDANDGHYLASLPIGQGVDSAGFIAKTGEAFSSQGDGTLTIIKELTPTTFAVEQNVATMPGARTSTLDSKTGHILLIAAEYAAPTPMPAPPVAIPTPADAPPAPGAPNVNPGGPMRGPDGQPINPGGPMIRPGDPANGQNGGGQNTGGGRRGGGRGRRATVPGSFSVIVVGKA